LEKYMDETQQAVKRLKGGDIGGLEPLVALYQVRALRTAFLILQDEAAAEDVVQETFLRIARHIRQFDESRPFEPYLLKSVVHGALNSSRHESRQLSLDGDLMEVEALLVHEDTPETRVESNQRSQQILSALAKLPPRQRAVIVQRYYLEMSEKEMSASLGAAPGTVKWLLNAARARLRGLLRSERNEP
jgi:RNA polymerase sigma-70 factor (ECF subfamily)